MWTTRRTKTAIVTPRPIRIAYLVPDPPIHALLDILIDESVSRWGGRRTPIVPVADDTITDDYWNLLSLWDADIIYTYVNITDRLMERLTHRLAPSALIKHPPENLNLRPYLNTNAQLLPSTSVLSSLARRNAFRALPITQIVDKERYAESPRDFTDSFNFVSNCLNDNSLLPHARRLSFRPPIDFRYAQRFRSPDEIDYVDNLTQLESLISTNRGLLCLAQMSDMFVPCLAALLAYRTTWEEHLTIVIGDDIEDRLLYWNAIHMYESLVESGNFQLIRLSHTRFVDGIPDWVSKFCSGQHNFRHTQGNAAPQIILRSCSVLVEDLKKIGKQIGDSQMVMCSVARHANSNVFGPLQTQPRANPPGAGHMVFVPKWQTPSARTEHQVRFENGDLEIPQVLPSHLRDAPIGPTTIGCWSVDIRIERNEDHSMYSNLVHRWMFPRRLRLESAVEVKNNGKDSLTFGLLPRPTEEGDLAIWDAVDWKRPLISMPSDLDAFRIAIAKHHPNIQHRSTSEDGLGLVYRFLPVQLSDKGRDLMGVFQLFRSLPEALVFLTNPYWLTAIERLTRTEPDQNPRRVQEIVEYFRNAVTKEDPDFHLIAKRVMNKTAEWMNVDNNHSINYPDLVKLLPTEFKNNEGKRSLERSVQYLRDRKFLRQGYAWKCSTCQHPNWVNLDDIVPLLECEICRAQKSSPVKGDENIYFRLNPFVASAFSSSSSQGPVFWALNRLATSASWSFMFSPAVDIYEPGSENRVGDIDILAAVDAEVYLLEVKKEFAGVNQSELDKLINLCKIVRPDVAGFAIRAPRSESPLDSAILRRAESILAEYDVKFVLWTSDDQVIWPLPETIPIAHGDTMDWSAF